MTSIESEITMVGKSMPATDDKNRPLLILRDRLPRLLQLLQIEPSIDLAAWANVLDTRLLPRLSPEFPLLVALAGGGSSGKSTLFNSLIEQNASLIGADAGLTRRVLVGLNPVLLNRHEFLCELFHPLQSVPDLLNHPRELAEPGPPKFVPCTRLPKNIVLLDTPDFDVGANDEYLNRNVAKRVLEACDVLVYIFTNASYNNLSNVNFVREIASSIGHRPCVLVYRAWDAYPDETVQRHAEMVASKLHGDTWKDHVLGVYRTSESNEVADGRTWIRLSALDREEPLLDLLGRLDPRNIRKSQIITVLNEVVAQAKQLVDGAQTSREELDLYADMIHLVQSHCVKSALQSLPIQEVGARVQKAWEKTGSRGIKALRGIGKVSGLPVRCTLGVAKWVHDKLAGVNAAPAKVADPIDIQLNDLTEAANTLYRTMLLEEVASSTTEADPDGKQLLRRVGAIRQRLSLSPDRPPRYEAADRDVFNIIVRAHPAVVDIREKVRKRIWANDLQDIREEARDVLNMPEQPQTTHDIEFNDELMQLVLTFRKRMTFTSKIKETLLASLHVLPPALAITYVVCTGDPAGGSTIFKLGTLTFHANVTGLFGLNDLWAVIALPVGEGLNKADQAQIMELLRPVVQKWFEGRSKATRAIFEERITKELSSTARQLAAEAESLEKAARQALLEIEHAM